MADWYIIAVDWTPAPHDAWPKARAAALKALELDPGAAGAHAALGMVEFLYEWDWAGAEGEFRRALDADPADPRVRVWYGMYLTAVGRRQEALAEMQRAQQLDPLSPEAGAFVAFTLYFARQYDQAIEQFHRVLEMERNYWLARYYLGWAHSRKGQ